MRLKLLFTLHVLACCFSGFGFAVEPQRIMAILENERLLEAEGGIKLVQFFNDPDPRIRARAVLAAARIGNQAVLAELIPLAQDKDSEARKLVAFALGQIRSKAGLAAAIQLLNDSDIEVQRLSVEAVGRIGGMEVSAILTAILGKSEIRLREQAALSLALIKDKGTVDALMKKASLPDPAQWSYVYALYRIADERTVPLLHEVIANPSASPATGEPSSLLFALKALWIMKKPLTRSEAERLLQHPDPRVRQNALDVMAVSGDKEFCQVIDRFYSVQNTMTQWKSIDAKGSLGCEVSISNTAPPVLIGAALQAIAKSKKDEALPQLAGYVKHPSWIVRWRLAQSLAGLKSELAIPLLKELAVDPESAVRISALESLAGYMPETAGIFTPLLKHSDFAIRTTAADALGKTKDRTYLPLLIETYRASADATEIEGRIAVLDVLSEYGSSEVLQIYQEALMDPEFTIRRHAIDGLKKIVGSQFFYKGSVVDPEEFLYLHKKADKELLERYPADFGKEMDDCIVDLTLENGTVRIRLFGKEAPIHVTNFKKLAESGFYDDLRIHRVVPNFVIQGGDPRGDGWGGAGEIVHDQINVQIYKRGYVGMPIAGKDTGGSQFFITHSRQPHLDGNYTIFGEVIEGMDVVDRTQIGDRILKVTVQKSL